MNFSFFGHHMEIGESLTSKAKNACELLESKYRAEFIDVNIVMKKDGYLFHCDISAKTNTGNSYYASSEADDPNVSFDLTLQKIDQQMQKKKKAERCFCRESRIEINNFDNSCEDSIPLIVADMLDDLPILSVSDAAKRLNEKTMVLVFENISSNAINIVYIRPDKNIGWIDYKLKK
ncbi:MAG: HPF/RaiA family ribosome-associated protein [Holosporaceae bacterium]|jgi:ribosomal subunit interface protein|nr:HPF/RaiA family ribosome-associated protein [Holosporaceae bacterium]